MKRYTMKAAPDIAEDCISYEVEDREGEWVRYSTARRLQATIRKLQEEIAELRGALDSGFNR